MLKPSGHEGVGRNRTAGTEFRKLLLYPLSYDPKWKNNPFTLHAEETPRSGESGRGQ